MTPSQNREQAAPYRENRRYFLRPTRIGRWRTYLAILVVFVTLSFAFAGFAFRGRLHRDVSRGPVAAVHAAWNDRCDACHTPFDQSKSLNPLAVRDRWHDFRCETCHAGPAG